MNQTMRRKYTEIPLLIDDNLKYVKGVTKYTTCSDVIKMILKKTERGTSDNKSDGFGIYERSRGIERLLPGKGRILKIMRSWGTDGQYELVFRKVNTTFSVPKISEAKRRKLTNRHRALHAETLAGLVETQKCKLNMNKANDSCEFVKEIYFNETDKSMDEFISQVDKSTMNGVLNFCNAVSNEEINKLSSASLDNLSRNVTGQSAESVLKCRANETTGYNVNDVKYAVRKSLKTKECLPAVESDVVDDRGTEIHGTPNLKAAKEKCRNIKSRHEKLASDIASKVARMNQREGKEALLRKYFADYITYRSPCYKYLDTRYRERGDGAEMGSDIPPCRKADGSDAHSYTPRRNTRCTPSSLKFDDQHDVSSDSGQEDDSDSLDTAFILNQQNLLTPCSAANESEADNGYKVPNVSPCNENDILNTNIEPESEYPVNKLVDYSLSEHDESELTEDPSIISSADENIHDVSSASDIVKDIFSDHKDVSEDDEMESFMKTKLYDDFYDEGLSSLGSDDENEIMV
ncbi:ras association [Mactra antiquata]